MARRTTKLAKPARVLNTTFVIIIALLIILIAFYTYKTYNSYNTLKEHRMYFAQKNASIQPWMTPFIIKKQFNITNDVLIEELHTNITASVNRMTLGSICTKQGLNCTLVIDALNAKRMSDK